LRGGAGRTRTSDQTIISRYSERGLRARNLRGPCCSNAFRKKAKHLALAGPLRWQVNPFPSLNQAPPVLYWRPMKVEEIAEVVAKLPPDQLARFRHWFTAFEAGRPDHAEELDSTATKLGRLAGHAFAELKKRAKEP
jgi:hypothetical protein